MLWIDKSFKDFIDFFKFDIKVDNLVVDVIFNMEVIFGFLLGNVYLISNDMLFFVVKSLRVNDFYRIVYLKLINIRRIIVFIGYFVRRIGVIKCVFLKIGNGCGEIGE